VFNNKGQQLDLNLRPSDYKAEFIYLKPSFSNDFGYI